MNIELILLVLGFALLVFLVFKVVKKVFVAAITVLGLVIGIFALLLGVVYLDYNYLTSQSNSNVYFAYENAGGFYDFAILVPIVDSSMKIEDARSLTSSELSELNVGRGDDGGIILSLNHRAVSSINPDGVSIEFSDYSIDFTNDEVLRVLESGDSKEVFLDIVSEKEGLTGFERELLRNELENFPLNEKEILLSASIVSGLSGERSALAMIESFKSGDINIEPGRISFYLLKKFFPAKTIAGFLPESI